MSLINYENPRSLPQGWEGYGTTRVWLLVYLAESLANPFAELGEVVAKGLSC